VSGIAARADAEFWRRLHGGKTLVSGMPPHVTDPKNCPLPPSCAARFEAS
jgi:hypothetical protein